MCLWQVAQIFVYFLRLQPPLDKVNFLQVDVPLEFQFLIPVPWAGAGSSLGKNSSQLLEKNKGWPAISSQNADQVLALKIELDMNVLYYRFTKNSETKNMKGLRLGEGEYCLVLKSLFDNECHIFKCSHIIITLALTIPSKTI